MDSLLWFVFWIKHTWVPDGQGDKDTSAFPPAHCAEAGVVGLILTHGQLVVPWVYLCDLSCVVKFPVTILYGVVLWYLDEDL